MRHHHPPPTTAERETISDFLRHYGTQSKRLPTSPIMFPALIAAARNGNFLAVENTTSSRVLCRRVD
ncbi:hypothetical protein E2P81_ATG06034 [Venturia nashicola]|nr:hypothetical protein E2P81_ATG06034 [Venturia nashicola]